MPVAVVAPTVGYQSESASGAAFKRVIGHSPRQFAKGEREVGGGSYRLGRPLLSDEPQLGSVSLHSAPKRTDRFRPVHDDIGMAATQCFRSEADKRLSTKPCHSRKASVMHHAAEAIGQWRRCCPRCQ